MPRTRNQRKSQRADEGTTGETCSITKDVLEQLAKSLAMQLASQLAIQGTSSSSTTPPRPPPPFNTNAPSAVRTLSTPKLGSPDTLTIPQFRDWKQRWNDFAKAQQLEKHPVDTQQGILRSALDEEWTMLWSSGRLQIGTTANLKEIVDLLEKYLRKKRNPLLDRKLFHQRDQMTGESVDRYYAALKALDDACAHEEEFLRTQCSGQCTTTCDACDFPFALANKLQETRIQDRLICGLLDKEMQRKVLAEQYSSVLTLERVLTICTAVENSNIVGATLSSPQDKAEVNAVKKSSYKKQQGQILEKKSSSSCWFCGSSSRHPKDACPAKDAKCKFCKKTGHFAKMCLKKKDAQPPPEENDDSGSSEEEDGKLHNNTVYSHSVKQLIPIRTEVAEQGSNISWLPDTGSDVDAISLEDFIKLGPKAASAFSSKKVEVLAANELSLGPIGSLQATLKLNGQTYATQLGVYQKLTTPLLSKQGCIALGLIHPNWPLPQIATRGTSAQPQLNVVTVGKKKKQRKEKIIHRAHSVIISEPKTTGVDEAKPPNIYLPPHKRKSVEDKKCHQRKPVKHEASCNNSSLWKRPEDQPRSDQPNLWFQAEEKLKGPRRHQSSFHIGPPQHVPNFYDGTKGPIFREGMWYVPIPFSIAMGKQPSPNHEEAR